MLEKNYLPVVCLHKVQFLYFPLIWNSVVSVEKSVTAFICLNLCSLWLFPDGFLCYTQQTKREIPKIEQLIGVNSMFIRILINTNVEMTKNGKVATIIYFWELFKAVFFYFCRHQTRAVSVTSVRSSNSNAQVRKMFPS